MMTKAEFYTLRIDKLKNRLNVFILCDGYDGWSWGVPISPIYFTYYEYIFIKEFLIEKFNYDLSSNIINGTYITSKYRKFSWQKNMHI